MFIFVIYLPNKQQSHKLLQTFKYFKTFASLVTRFKLQSYYCLGFSEINLFLKFYLILVIMGSY